MRKKHKHTKKIQLKNNLQEIYRDINKTKQQNQKVRLLAVSKTHPKEILQQAAALGIKYFGENKIQEAETKAPHLPRNTELHLIGHLQSNKIKKAQKKKKRNPLLLRHNIKILILLTKKRLL